MPRVIAYLGSPCSVGALIEGGNPSFVTSSGDCAHGFGATWYPPDGEPSAARLVDRLPLAAAIHHRMMLGRLGGGSISVVAASELAEAPTTVEGLQPFAPGNFTFANTGDLSPYLDAFARPLRDGLGAAAHRWLPSSSPSAMLAAMWLDRLGDGQGPDAMAGALDSVISEVRRVAAPAAALATFGSVISDGRCLVALRTATHGEPPPLFTTLAAVGTPVPAGARVIASEPCFGGEWTELEPHALTIFTID